MQPLKCESDIDNVLRTIQLCPYLHCDQQIFHEHVDTANIFTMPYMAHWAMFTVSICEAIMNFKSGLTRHEVELH